MVSAHLTIFTVADGVDRAQVLPFVLGWVVGIAIVAALVRSGIDLGDDHLIVRNGFRHHHLERSEVRHAELGRRLGKSCIEIRTVGLVPLRTWMFTDLGVGVGLLRRHVDTINEWIAVASSPADTTSPVG